MKDTGKLIVVPTPIGNLADMTYRAVSVLQSCDVILAEDTRTSRKLLNHYEITEKPVKPYHKFNEHKQLEVLLSQLKAGSVMALISDAGTPAVSDPGFLLVREAIREGVEVETLPGATAFVPALVNSGLPINSFVFEGFLPVKKGRQTKLKQLADEQHTMVFYESPHRLLKTLNDFVVYFGETRLASVSRELTKLYEETVRGTLAEIITQFEAKSVKGEIVIVVSGKENKS
jgi:16S rRNA (cytidine1402-2'-O)-methyltransferase